MEAAVRCTVDHPPEVSLRLRHSHRRPVADRAGHRGATHQRGLEVGHPPVGSFGELAGRPEARFG